MRAVVIEGKPVSNILLDTGCSRTLVHWDLVPPGKLLEGRAITICCAHEDKAIYSLAKVGLDIEGKHIEVEAGVADRLPMGALLGTDIPQLKNLLMNNKKAEEMVEHAMVVTKQAAKREKEAEKVRKQEQSGVMPHLFFPAKESEKTQSTLDSTLKEEDWMLQIEDDVLGEPKNHPEKLQLSRRQKRRNNSEYIAMKEVKQAGYEGLAGINLEKFKQLQVENPTLETSWEGVQDEASSGQEGFFQRDGRLYRHWIPPWRDGDEMSVEQLVLPRHCRESVMKIAHSVPMAGHLGRDKTVQRMLQRFYCPSVHQDVARFCRACDPCQKVAHKKVAPVPLIPLPIVDVPFKRLAMDIVGALLKS